MSSDVFLHHSRAGDDVDGCAEETDMFGSSDGCGCGKFIKARNLKIVEHGVPFHGFSSVVGTRLRASTSLVLARVWAELLIVHPTDITRLHLYHFWTLISMRHGVSK